MVKESLPIHRLPKKILDLFPRWEYRCPICGTYVEPIIVKCPKCGFLFNEIEWRTPPRFLKSYKAMSEYAHKVLAPKLNEKQRVFLFKFFTELFNDGFETGDFSAWDGTANYYGSSSIVSTPVYQGSYAAKFTCTDDSLGAYAVSYKTLSSSYSTIFMRVYLRLSALPSSARFGCYKLRNSGSASDQFYIGVLNDAGTEKWGVFVEYTDTWYTYTEDITLDTWYCIEVKIVRDSSNGEVHLWRNGTEIISQTGINTGANDINKVYAGYQHTSSMGGSGALVDVYVDCVVVADTYIGPIEETTFVSKELNFKYRTGIHIISDFSKNLDKGFLVDYVRQNLFGLFKIKRRIYKPILIQFNTFRRIFQYLIFNFRIFNYRIKELFIKYNLKTIIIKYLNIVHSIIRKIIKIVTFQYSIGLAIEKILNIGFNLISRIFKTISTIWLIKNLRLRVFVLTNKIKESIISILTLFHSLVGRILRVLNISYSSGLFIEVLMNISYFLISRIKKTFSFGNNILKYISKSISSIFKIREYRESLLVFFSNIMNILKKTILVSYISKSIVYSLTTISYTLNKFITRIFTSIYDIFTTEIVYKIQSISYSLSGLLKRILVFKYPIKEIILYLFTLKNNVRRYLSNIFSLLYELLTKQFVSKIHSISYNLAGLLERLLLINYSIREFISSIFRIINSIKVYIRRTVISKYIIKQYTIISTLLKYNTKKYIIRISEILYNNFKYLTIIFQVVYLVPKAIVIIFSIVNNIIKRISTIFSTLYNVGFLKLYNILSLKYGVIRKLTILTLRIKQILPRFKIPTLQKTLKVKLDTLKYRIKEILRRG